MTKLEEILTDAAEHRLWIRCLWPLSEPVSTDTENDMANRFIRTFFPKEFKEHFE
jgi:hypothetical protein